MPLHALEADRLFRRAPGRLIAILGPKNAGKTCLITSLFLQLSSPRRGGLPYRFAGSRSLFAFRGYCDRALRWSGRHEDEIIGHTPKEESEHPRIFLHLGLRPQELSDDRVIDALLTEISGEWVTEWCEAQDERARHRFSFMPRCDVVLVLADANALLGRGGRALAGETEILLRRLAHQFRGIHPPPAVALVLSKLDEVWERDDVDIPSENARERHSWGKIGRRAKAVWAGLDALEELGVEVQVFGVSAFPGPLTERLPVGVVPLFEWALSRGERRVPLIGRPSPVPEPVSSFNAYRRWPPQVRS